MTDERAVAQALLTNYEPSLRDRVGNAIYDIAQALGMGSTANRMRNEGTAVMDFIPGVGEVLGINDAMNDFSAGNYGMGAAGLGLTAVGAVPGVGDAVANAGRKGIRAFHGSPHDFDRFSMDKIGTGEGAQAYGHGLYFAENEGVARSYRDALADKGIDGKDPVANAWDMIYRLSDNDPVQRAEIRQSFVDMAQGDDKYADFARRTVEAIDSGAVDQFKAPGHMYEVNIRANPDDFLDWDLPLEQQSEKINELVGSRLEQFLDAAGPQIQAPYDRFIAGQTTGEEAYKLLHPQAGIDQVDWSRGLSEQAAQRLRDTGFAGIKYLDQGSRGAGEGSRNYVVFDDSLIEIVRKYGIAAALGAGLISQEMAAQMQAQGIEEL